MQSFLDAALTYAELGYRVFPCVPGGKEPACEHGCLDATTDAEQVTMWWDRQPNCNVAIATDGLFVLDVDPAGKAWLATIDAGQLLQGSMTATPRGGVHYWFRQDDGDELRNTTSKIAPGVDTRANGGYVLVPPSVVGGRAYHWVTDLEAQQPVVPRWLLELLGQKVLVRDSVAGVIPEGTRNNSMFRFAGFFRRGGMMEDEILTALRGVNARRCQPPLPDGELAQMARSASRFQPDFLEEAMILSHLGNDIQVPDDDELVIKPVDAVFPVQCLETMPSVMREAYEFVIDSAIKPQPQLTLGALVALFGACFGRKVCDDYDTRTNVMVLALAPSGSGKEHPRQCNKKLLLASGQDKINAPERIGSHAGIISAVHANPVRLFQLDEIGRLLATMRDPKASHLYNIGTVLMALYSSSNTLWTGDAYADLNKVKSIPQPHVCVYGTSVPESLYGGLSPENLTDGLVGRLLVFQSLDLPERRKPKQPPIPFRVTSTLRYWATFDTPESGNLDDPVPIKATKTDEADQRHEDYCDEINRRHKTDDNISSAIWSRAPEKAAKLALIFACCESGGDPPEPVITLQAVNWGIALANYSTRLVLLAARNSIAGSRYEADLKFVFQAINGDISHHQLTRKTQRLKRKERLEILADLESSGAIEIVQVETGKRKKIVYRRRQGSL